MQALIKLKYLLKTIKRLGLSIFSLKIITCLALEQKLRAVQIAKDQLQVDPCNWKIYKFLLEYYTITDNLRLSVKLYDQFISALFLSISNHAITSEYQSISKSFIEAFFLSSSDKQDFCEIDFLGAGASWPPSYSLHIIFAGRFSNFLIQLSNAISIAALFNIQDIYVTPSREVLNVFPDFREVLCANSNIKIRFIDPKSGFVIRSFFFHVCRHMGEFLYASSSFKETVSSFRQNTFFPQDPHQDSIPSLDVSDKNLVIHLRSGDIFASKNVHTDYGQPPLSYYKVAIDHYQPSSVILVYEDMLNPVIAALIDHLLVNNIPYIIQCSDLLSDLDVLRKASALVMSRGTFAFGILCINDKLRSVYCFNSSAEHDSLMKLHALSYFYGERNPIRRPVMFEVVDTTGVYFDSICSKNWFNSGFQRQLMLSYPVDNLAIRETC